MLSIPVVKLIMSTCSIIILLLSVRSETFKNTSKGRHYNHIMHNLDSCINYTAGMAGYDALTIQQFDVYDDLADILETDFTGGNKILAEMQDFYRSCIFAAQMNQTEAIILPTRQFYQELGQSTPHAPPPHTHTCTHTCTCVCMHVPSLSHTAYMA